jgi:hypothetical protein
MTAVHIQEAISNGYQGVTDYLSAAGQWISRTVTDAGAFISSSASKAAEVAKPYFEHVKTFAEKNGDSIIVGVIAFIAGSILTTIFTNICNTFTSTSSPAP